MSPSEFHFLIPGPGLCYTLEKADRCLDEFAEFWGDDLVTVEAPNGMRWFDRRQVDCFLAD